MCEKLRKVVDPVVVDEDWDRALGEALGCNIKKQARGGGSKEGSSLGTEDDEPADIFMIGASE